MNITQKKANVFWTGGWDSTFEMCRLSLKPIEIQPVYIIMDRPFHIGQEYEVKAQDVILNKLKNRNTTKAKILPLIRIHRNNIQLPKYIHSVFENLEKTEEKLGTQYYYFSAYAQNHPNMRVMISDYYHSVSRTMKLIRQCNCQFDEENTMYILKEKSNKLAYNLFGHCVFPLATINQEDIIQWIRQHQFEDIMKEIWTCWYPIDNKPCGFCHACRIKIKQNLDFFFTEKALKRGFAFNYLCSNENYRKEYLPIFFGVWLRKKYNKDLQNFPFRYDKTFFNETRSMEYYKKYKKFMSDSFSIRYQPYINFFETLLQNPPKCRTMIDSFQRFGLF